MRIISFNRRTAFFVLLIVLILSPSLFATMSIVAVDTVTGAVGGAGASCIYGSAIINDLIEGIGAIHCQSYINAQNQENAHNLMVAGLTPDSILNWLYYNDAEGTPNMRQYIAVTLAGPANSAAFSGAFNPEYQNQVYGPGYAIAGNRLLTPDVIMNMEAAFLSTAGELADKLMAALQAANIPGADSECLQYNKPALSSFIRVVKPGDGDALYLDKVINAVYGFDNPIDSLQILFNLWKALRYADAIISTVETSAGILAVGCTDSSIITITPRNHEGQMPVYGVDSITLSSDGIGILSDVMDNGDNTYTVLAYALETPGTDTIGVVVYAGGEAIALNQKAVIDYYMVGDADANKLVNILDITFLISFLYKEGPPPVPSIRADGNADGTINILDVTYLIGYLYKNGSEPVCPQY